MQFTSVLMFFCSSEQDLCKQGPKKGLRLSYQGGQLFCYFMGYSPFLTVEPSRRCIRNVTAPDMWRLWWAEAWLKIQLLGNGRKQEGNSNSCTLWYLFGVVLFKGQHFPHGNKGVLEGSVPNNPNVVARRCKTVCVPMAITVQSSALHTVSKNLT